MGAKHSKTRYSGCDDLVSDNYNDLLKLQEVVHHVSHTTATNAAATDVKPTTHDWATSNEVLQIVVHCCEDTLVPPPPAAANTVNTAECFNNTAKGHLPLIIQSYYAAKPLPHSQPKGITSHEIPVSSFSPNSGPSTPKAMYPAVYPAALAAEQSATVSATRSWAASPCRTPHPESYRDSAPAQAVARPQDAVAVEQSPVEQVFCCVDWEQQQQDKAQALARLATAAAATPRLSPAERQSLKAAGRASQLAEQDHLALQLNATDLQLQGMHHQDRTDWFQAHAEQQAIDTAEMSFDDEWNSLPAEVLAMVKEMQSKV